MRELQNFLRNSGIIGLRTLEKYSLKTAGLLTSEPLKICPKKFTSLKNIYSEHQRH